MDMTPPSLTRSSASPPNTYCHSDTSSLDYPSPGLVEPHYRLGSLYDQSCAVPPTAVGSDDHSLPSLDSMNHSDWISTTTVMHHPTSISGLPNVLSAEYDPFANYDASIPTPYNQNLYRAHPSGLSAMTCTPPPFAGRPSRSPAPSSRPSLSYSHRGSPAPRIKMEPLGDYDLSQYPSPRSMSVMPGDHEHYATSSAGYLSDSNSNAWPKSEYASLESDPYYYGTAAAGPSYSESRPRMSQRPKRSQRKLTTKDEANFQCEVKGCGKLFSRSYNYKAHLETHDEHREYPFQCTENECGKRFVRKTDLQRHHGSVHLKEKTHGCDYCGRMFSRKDTLRRHMEDGCSKRFDIGTLDLRGEHYDTFNPSSRSYAASMSQYIQAPAQLPPLANSGTTGGAILAPMPPLARR